ncbi:gluconate 2-dehydrogenase subunit 3 family protein [Sporosarcina sp. GW1-11]|uniref:gluconate 2-dehydrogenase subunit 3 family protein n=1 Tax=Sporosarcina sp. GW1-11 TaxID=2899126 RepID=UPI00294E4CA2|nr:gluconate 2-dehydrogenase subunit 3 family protein [Sporosarcina sp. GW1-11]MDV6377428.1 gluconate 2-dehydrogenase subunit 3 family protein [Sporosarcina sp. GW1-11]
MKTTGIATGVLLGGGLIGGLVGYKSKKSKNVLKEDKTEQVDLEVGGYGQMFFANPNEFDILSAAIKRIFPEYEIGSGVSYFIDNQLVGNYGSNLEKYTQETLRLDESTQSDQTHLTRGEIFRQGIAKLEEEAIRVFGKCFVELEEEQMDCILNSFKRNEVSMPDVSSGLFYSLLLSATLKGIYSDPNYNGNLNIEGISEHQLSFLNEIESEKALKLEPQPVGSLEQ